MWDLPPEPPDPPPIAAAAPIAAPINNIPAESLVTSTPGGKYMKGNPQPLLSDLISFMLLSFSIGLPRKSFVFTKIVSPLLKVTIGSFPFTVTFLSVRLKI